MFPVIIITKLPIGILKFDFFKKKKMEIVANGKIQNATAPTVMILFQPNFFWMFHVTVLTKVTYWDFEISYFIFFKYDWIFCNIVANG